MALHAAARVVVVWTGPLALRAVASSIQEPNTCAHESPVLPVSCSQWVVSNWKTLLSMISSGALSAMEVGKPGGN